MPSRCTAAIEHLIESCLDPFLATASFDRRGRKRWYRTRDPFVDLLRLRRASSHLSCAVTVEFSLFSPIVYRLYHGREPRPFLHQGHCLLTARVGGFRKGWLGMWWDIDPASENNLVCVELRREIEADALAFFGSVTTLQDLLRLSGARGVQWAGLDARPCLAIVQYLAGDRASARELLEGRYRASVDGTARVLAAPGSEATKCAIAEAHDAYRAHILAIAARLGLELSP